MKQNKHWLGESKEAGGYTVKWMGLFFFITQEFYAKSL